MRSPRGLEGVTASFVPFAVLYGLLLGARHALEPDHLAAVSTLAAHGSSRTQVLSVAAAWGGGHATAVTVAGILLSAARLPIWLAGRAELLAGFALVALGLYLVCFGIGSLRGMVAVGIMAIWPLVRISAHLPRAQSWLQGAAGLGSVAVGLLLIARVGGLIR